MHMLLQAEISIEIVCVGKLPIYKYRKNEQ